MALRPLDKAAAAGKTRPKKPAHFSGSSFSRPAEQYKKYSFREEEEVEEE